MADLLVLGIIPARSGSKGIPNKNIVLLHKKPLIAYTIETALESKSFDRLIVSTDSPKIADISKQYGAEVPFLRPPEISRDDTPGIEPVLHALNWFQQEERYTPDFVMLLQPTSPFRAVKDIRAALHLASTDSADAVISITPVRNHPFWMKTLNPDGTLSDFMPLQSFYAKRQDLPPVYSLNGAIYLARLATILQHRTFFVPNARGYIMPPDRSIDIDTPWDLHLATSILDERKTHEIH